MSEYGAGDQGGAAEPGPRSAEQAHDDRSAHSLVAPGRQEVSEDTGAQSGGRAVRRSPEAVDGGERP